MGYLYLKSLPYLQSNFGKQKKILLALKEVLDSKLRKRVAVREINLLQSRILSK